MPRIVSRRTLWLLLLLLASGVVVACNAYGSIGIGGPYIGMGPVGISTGVSIGFPL
ncbi:MAG: hypothetical protein MUC69_05155 [Gemmatimonadales bacterium]|jgi:hypothetical protein|nr:hypothetical protein [Gemmatimonadales bacterium]